MSFLYLFIHFIGHRVWARPMLVAGETKRNKTGSGKQGVLIFWGILMQCKKRDRKEDSKMETHAHWRKGIEKMHQVSKPELVHLRFLCNLKTAQAVPEGPKSCQKGNSPGPGGYI